MSSRPSTPREALQRLIEGNERFVRRQPIHGTVSEETFASLREGQRPFAAILGCSDSRVPLELVFDQTFGDLFVIRLAGNVVAPEVVGSIQFAHRQLGTSLLAVVGHEDCGAVKAALAAKFHRAQHPERIQHLVDMIAPALEHIDPKQNSTEQLSAGVEANVRWSIHQIISTSETQEAFREERNILIVGAVYDLTSGKVRWLDDQKAQRG
jgi:carbonic anhydrase